MAFFDKVRSMLGRPGERDRTGLSTTAATPGPAQAVARGGGSGTDDVRPPDDRGGEGGPPSREDPLAPPER